MCGSRGARDVESELRRRFGDLGYEIQELPFSFSAFPGRYGPSLVGVLLAAVVLGAGASLWFGQPEVSLWWLGGGAVAGVALGLLARPAIRWLPIQRMHASNWLVARPGAVPAYVVVAHRDSKSQPSSLLLRAIAAAAGPLSLITLTAVAIIETIRPTWITAVLVLPAVAAGLGSGLVLIFCYAANRSPGALDNASGLAALLALASRERSRDVAFLVTDAEELGLAGAAAACLCVPRHAAIINLDGLDDDGPFHIMDRRVGPPSADARSVVAALLDAAEELGFRAAHRALPPGVLVDHIPFAAAGFAAVTIMRGSLTSLGRVHRPQDSIAQMRGWGAADAALLVSSALDLLRSRR